MDKSRKITVHLVMTAAAWLIFAVCLIRFLAAYGSLEDEIGIHFAGDGSFDVIDKKVFGFYPFIVSVITLVICAVLNLLVNKVKVSKKVTERGAELMRFGVRSYIDLFRLGMVFFFSGVWSDCVIRQNPLDTRIPNSITLTLFGGLLALIVFMTVVRIKHREKK